MPRQVQELTPLEIGRLRTPGLHAVGGVPGLCLQVTDSGARTWILRATVGDRRRDIGLGGFPAVTVAGAREAARAAREKIRAGIDPVEERRAARHALIAARASAITFEEAATKYIAANAAGWKNAKHTAQWTATLNKYVYPQFGKLSVSRIETPHVIGVLEPIWTTKNETAKRVCGRIEAVLDWAKVRGYRHGENPARWKGHLDHILPAPSKVQRVKHHPALDYRLMKSFMTELRQSQGMGARALEFAILTASRSGEVRGATWSELDSVDDIWIIPAERMKAGKEHRVPLSQSALALLNALPRPPGIDLIFPSDKHTELSDMTLTATIRRLNEARLKAGLDGWRDASGRTATVHGFRSSFRDWAGETTPHPREVIEAALAHQLKDKAEAAYARGDLLEKRRRLMEDWADHCNLVTSHSLPNTHVAAGDGALARKDQDQELAYLGVAARGPVKPQE